MTELRNLNCYHSADEADIQRLAPAIGANGWVLLQSYSAKPTFQTWSQGEALPALGKEFAGRIFGANAEIRWLRDPSGFQLWHYWETASGEKFRAVKRAYYCLGYWKKDQFWEPSLPEAIKYPPTAPPNDLDRPRFHAFEYYRLPPAAWPDSLEAVEDLLNQPLLFAYRLTGFDVGKD